MSVNILDNLNIGDDDLEKIRDYEHLLEDAYINVGKAYERLNISQTVLNKVKISRENFIKSLVDKYSIPKGKEWAVNLSNGKIILE